MAGRKQPRDLRQEINPEPLPSFNSPLGTQPAKQQAWRPDPDYRFKRCAIGFCPNEASQRYQLPLCQEHILAIWLTVEEDMRNAGWTPDQMRAAAKRNHGTVADGQVYYLKIDDYIKIGYTKNLKRRMLQYPPNAELLAHNPGTEADERRIHEKFSAYLTSGREWFRDVPEIRRHIENKIAQHGSPNRFDRNDAENHPTPRLRTKTRAGAPIR